MKHEPHPHYDMIVAKAANMDLVIFRKDYQNTPWRRLADSELPTDEGREYFLCLPQHKDSVLAGLNGADLEYLDEDDLDEGGDGWYSAFVNKWSETNWCMTDPNIQIRIKPRKEKRWIGVRSKDGATTMAHATIQKTRSDVVGLTGNWQFIEIEVDV